MGLIKNHTPKHTLVSSKKQKKFNLNVICQRGVNDIRAQLHIQRIRRK